MTADPARTPDFERAGPASPVPPGTSRRLSWRAAGIGLTSFGTPAGLGALHPLFGELIAMTEVAVMLTIIGTALFASQALSERAFRLLRWIRNHPEPPDSAVHTAEAGPATYRLPALTC